MKYLTLLALLFVSGCAGRLHIESTPLEEVQPEGTITVIDEDGTVSYEYPRYYVEDHKGNRHGPFKSWRLTYPGGHHVKTEDSQGHQHVFGGNFHLEER